MLPKAIWILALQYATAHVVYNPNSNTLSCTKPGGQYCVNGTLNGPTMLSCISSTLAEIQSCNIELSLILPSRYNKSAVCYETSPDAGNALCAFNGIGYTLAGALVAVPETRLQQDQFPVPDESRLRPDLTAFAWAMQSSTNKGKDRADADADAEDEVSLTTTSTQRTTSICTRSTINMDVSHTNTNEPTPSVHPLALIVKSSNTSTEATSDTPQDQGPLTSNLPLDPSGEAETIVSAISSAAATSTGVMTSTGDSTTLVFTTTAVDTSSPRGIVLVEPTGKTTAADKSSSSSSSSSSESQAQISSGSRTTSTACLIAAAAAGLVIATTAGLIRS